MSYECKNSDYIEIINIIKDQCRQESENPLSIFYFNPNYKEGKWIDVELKKLISKRVGKTTIAIANKIKHSLSSKGLFYFSQRDLANFLGVRLRAVQQSIELLSKYTNIKFIRFPARFFPKQSKKFKKVIWLLLPPNLVSTLNEFFNELQVTIDRPSSDYSKELKRLYIEEISNKYQVFTDHPYIYTPIQFTYLFILNKFKINKHNFDQSCVHETNAFDFQKTSLKDKEGKDKDEEILISNKNFLVEDKNCSPITKKEQSLVKKINLKKERVLTPNQKPIEEKICSQIKKINLTKKPSIVTYDTYGLKPSNFFKDDFGRFLDKCLDFVIKKNIAPDFDTTERIIKYWNSIDNPLLSNHRINRNSLTFKKIALVLMYRMTTNNIGFDEITAAADLFNDLTKYNKPLQKKRKITLLETFLWNSTIYSDIKWFESCIQPRDIAFKLTNTAQPKFPKTMERCKNAFLNEFYPDIDDRKTGEFVFESNYYLFKRFSDDMVKYHQNLEMCDLSKSMDKFMKEYFEIVYKLTNNSTIEYHHKPSYILSNLMISNFVSVKRSEPYCKEFWNEKKESKKTT